MDSKQPRLVPGLSTLAVLMFVGSAWIWAARGGPWLRYLLLLLAGGAIGALNWLWVKRHPEKPPTAATRTIFVGVGLVVVAVTRATLPESFIPAIITFCAGGLLASVFPTDGATQEG